MVVVAKPAMPVTLPSASTVPAAVLLLVHVPPPVLLLRSDDEPTQVLSVPVIAPGNEFTVTMTVEEQPEIV